MEYTAVVLLVVLFVLGVIVAGYWTKCLVLGFRLNERKGNSVLDETPQEVYDMSKVGEPFVTLVNLLKSKPERWTWWRNGLEYCKGSRVIKVYLTFEYERGEMYVDSLHNIEVEGKYIYPTPDEKLYVKEEANIWLKRRLEEDNIKLEKLKAAERYKALKELQGEL